MLMIWSWWKEFNKFGNDMMAKIEARDDRYDAQDAFSIGLLCIVW